MSPGRRICELGSPEQCKTPDLGLSLHEREFLKDQNRGMFPF